MADSKADSPTVRVKCPKCNHSVKPSGDKCPDCGHAGIGKLQRTKSRMMSEAAMAKGLQEAVTENPLTLSEAAVSYLEEVSVEDAVGALAWDDWLSMEEAADSLKKASTPEPFSTSKTSNWVAKGGGLPAYIQHIAHDLHEKRGKSVSNAIQMAIGIVKNWASGKGNVDANTRAAASKAVAEWTALKAKAHAT